MKKSELRILIKEELNELSKLKIKGSEYFHPDFNKNVYISEDGVLGFREFNIDWNNIKQIYNFGKKNNWV